MQESEANQNSEKNSPNAKISVEIATQLELGLGFITRPCLKCGTIFAASGQQRHKRKYCSTLCRDRFNHERWVREHQERRAKHNRKYYTLKTYKLSPEDFEALIEKQNNTCPICKQQFAPNRKPCIDHDHTCCPSRPTCGKCTRGLLCVSCNGWLEKLLNLEYRKAVEDYLWQHNIGKNSRSLSSVM